MNSALERAVANVEGAVDALKHADTHVPHCTQVFDTLPESAVVGKVAKFQAAILAQLEKDAKALEEILTKYGAEQGEEESESV